MRIFVTGATGFIGSAVVQDLLAAGHQVIGLCRSDDKVAALAATGAEVYRGTIAEPETLIEGASRADGIIHLAFKHDFSRFQQNCEDDRAVIKTLASALAGSDRPLVVTSVTAIANVVPGQAALEDNPVIGVEIHPRAATEEAARLAAADGVNVSVVRLPQVHDTQRQGLITPLIAMYREKGVCTYVGDGATCWPAAYRLDVARLYRLAVERAERNAKYHAVAEEGVSIRDTAMVLGKRLGLPVKSITAAEAPEYYGWMARFAEFDMPASSKLTQEKLGWTPTGPGLLEHLAKLELEET